MNREKSEALGSMIYSYEERKKKVSKFQMTSDIFFGKVMEDKAACQEVVRILLQDEGFVVKEVKIQYTIRSLESHSVVLDILAEAADGRLAEIEMQMSEGGDHQKRVRYYLANIEMSFLEKGVPYDELPDVYMIFVTQKDFLKQGSGLYYVDRVIRNKGRILENGVHEIYANLECTSGDEKVDELLAYMGRSDSDYKTEIFPNVVKRVKFLKEQKEGLSIMCSILDEERQEGKREGIREGKREGIREGMRKGELMKLIALVHKKCKKGKALSDIAEELEEEAETLRPIYTMIMERPDSNEESIYQRLKQQEYM